METVDVVDYGDLEEQFDKVGKLVTHMSRRRDAVDGWRVSHIIDNSCLGAVCSVLRISRAVAFLWINAVETHCPVKPVRNRGKSIRIDSHRFRDQSLHFGSCVGLSSTRGASIRIEYAAPKLKKVITPVSQSNYLSTTDFWRSEMSLGTERNGRRRKITLSIHIRNIVNRQIEFSSYFNLCISGYVNTRSNRPTCLLVGFNG